MDRHVAHTEAPTLESQFPYDSLPRAFLDAVETPMRPAPSPTITDTTFRDGQQAREPFTADQIVRLFTLLRSLDNGCGIIRQSEFFLYSEDERRAVERCLAQGPGFPEVTGWIRARKEDLHLVRDMGIRETGLLTSVSDLHIKRKLGWTRAEAQSRYLEVVDEALAAGIRPRCHFEDVTRADIEGFVVPFARALIERGRQSGIPVKIRLCDTMGVALPWPAATLPRGVPKLVRALTDEAEMPPELLEWHGHNDFFKGHANAVTAWLYGCGAVNTTLFGIGERCGNSPLEGALVEHCGLFGSANATGKAPNLHVLGEIADVLRQCGHTVPSSYPLVGGEAFSTRAGVHIDGLLKDPSTYLSFDPLRVLGRPAEVVISDRSGTAGMAWWINARRLSAGMTPVSKLDPGVAAAYAALMARYAAGTAADPDDHELFELVSRSAPELLPDSTPLEEHCKSA